MLSHLDLFSGIGGFSLGLESAGLVETVAFCDYDKYCQQVLKKHWPDVPIYGDVKELTHERLKADGIDTIDIITGGYPCQPFSVAGSQKGEQDPRHVWPEMFRLIQELKPSWVIGENVSGHIKLGLDTVLENLESEGYSARTFSISASSVGANHQRERIWIVGNSTSNGRNKSKSNKTSESVIGQSKEGGMLKPERASDVENSRRSSGREQSSGYKESFGLWSFETSEWSTDTNQITGSSERAKTMADTESKRGREPGHIDKEKRNTKSSATQSQSCSADVADTESIKSWEQTEWEGRKNSSGGSSNSRGHSQEGTKDVADTSTHRSFDEPKRNIGGLEKESGRKEETRHQPSVCIETRSSKRSKNVADTNSKRGCLRETGGEDAKDVGQSPRGEETLGWWDIEPNVGRVAHGIPKRVDRLKCLGNSVVPQIPFLIGLAIKETIENE